MNIVDLENGLQGEAVITYNLGNDRIAVWKRTDGSWIVTDSSTRKSLLCICPEQALDIFDRCVENLAWAKA